MSRADVSPVDDEPLPVREREHAGDEVFPQDRIFQPAALFDGQFRPPLDDFGCEDAAAVTVRRHAGFTVHLHAIQPAGRRILHEDVAADVGQCRQHLCAYARSGSVTSTVGSFTPRARGAATSPTSRIGSRGTPMPIASSGQMPRSSNRPASCSWHNEERLWPPSKRTSAPVRQSLTATMRGGAGDPATRRRHEPTMKSQSESAPACRDLSADRCCQWLSRPYSSRHASNRRVK